MGGVAFLLIDTDDFHHKLENKRFAAARLRCCQNIKFDKFKSSFGRLREKKELMCVLHVQHYCFSSFS